VTRKRAVPPRVGRLVAAVASGLLLAAARPPLDLGLLACAALVPLFVAWRDRRPLAAAGYAFAAGAVYHGITVSWVWHLSVVAFVALAVALAGYWAAAGALVAWLRGRNLASPWLTAAVWVCADALAARVPFGGLSWDEIGYAFHDFTPARAVASVGGLTLVTFLAVALNGLLADAAVRLEPAARRRALSGLAWVGMGVAIVVGVATLATAIRWEPTPTGRLRVAVLQGNDKNRDLTDAEARAEYLQQSHLRLAARVGDFVDLIVFPESSMNDEVNADYQVARDTRLAGVARRHHAWVLANATVSAPDGTHNLNQNVLFRPDGTVEGTYDKRHLVPFGEYVWGRSVVEAIVPSIRDQVPRDFERGKRAAFFEVAGHKLTTVICFESAFGYQVRPLVHDGAQIIVVSTNNRSYERSANSAQHVAIGQMRAAETGRPVVQAAISGISAFIDADGNVHGHARLFDRTILEQTITTTSGQTPYVRYGEWVLWASAIAVAACVLLALSRHRLGRRGAVRRDRIGSVDSEPAGETARDGSTGPATRVSSSGLTSSGDRT
jgi:apolipoprotein N-acyltransferase